MQLIIKRYFFAISLLILITITMAFLPADDASAINAEEYLLITCVLADDSDCVYGLIDYGVNVNAVDESGNTALIYAAYNNRYNIAEALIYAGADIEYQNGYGFNAILGAASNNHLEICRLLLDFHANPDSCENEGRTALMFAAQHNNTEMISLFIEYEADVYFVNRSGYNALDLAINCNSTEAVSILSEYIMDYFDVYFEQFGDRIDIDSNNEVKLKREPFAIVIELINTDEVLVNASTTDDTFSAAMGNPRTTFNLPGFTETGMADVRFNEDEILMIKHDAPNYWYYSEPDDHRFNFIEEQNDSTLCYRAVSYILDIDSTDRESISITDFEEENLYLVFIVGDWNSAYTFRRISQCIPVHITLTQ